MIKNRRGSVTWVPLLVLATFLVFMLAGCGGSPMPADNKPPDPPPGQQQEQAGPVPEPGQQPVQAPQPAQPAQTPPSESAISLVHAVVTKVVDGDTVHVDIGGRTEKVRLIGVDTPETVHPDRPEEPFGREARAFARAELDGQKVWLELDVRERCKYGRLLAYVWLEQPVSGTEAEVRAKMFNAGLLLEGYAQVMTVPPNVKYTDLFVKFQREAREGNRGLWGIAPQDPAATQEPATPQDPAAKGAFVGSAKSDKYHLPDCRWAERIAPANEIWFASAAEAGAQGYKPCGTCRPPG